MYLEVDRIAQINDEFELEPGDQIIVLEETTSIKLLSDDTEQWLRRWHGGGGYKNQTHFNGKISEELRPYRLQKATRLYRLVNLRDPDTREEFLHHSSKNSIDELWGGNIYITTNSLTSWSYNEKETVETFSYDPKWDRLLTGLFEPDDSIVDLTYFQEFWSDRGGEEEVVIAPGTYRIAARGIR
mgnify:CR=1 FL=1